MLALKIGFDLIVAGIKNAPQLSLLRLKARFDFTKACVKHAFYFAGKLLGGFRIAHDGILSGSRVRR